MGASFLTARNLTAAGFRHAFFTRQGGHSPPPFDSLHFGALGNTEEQLAANVRAAAHVLGVSPARLYTAKQVHGRDVLSVNAGDDRLQTGACRSDALLAREEGTACAIKTADCIPLLLAEQETGAVVAVHSGWQGTVANVAGAAVAALRRMTERQGALLAAIGPHIRSCCFEVGVDVATQLAVAAGRDEVIEHRFGVRPRVDLARVVRLQLTTAGVAEESIELVDGCSRCDGLRFFSHRRDGERSGRNLAAIVARGRSRNPQAP